MSGASFQLSHPAPETLAVSGALTFATAGDALSAARAELDSHRAVTRLDLAGLGPVDSAGLATVLALLAHVRSQGRTLAVVQAPAGLSALARVSGVEALL